METFNPNTDLQKAVKEWDIRKRDEAAAEARRAEEAADRDYRKRLAPDIPVLRAYATAVEEIQFEPLWSQSAQVVANEATVQIRTGIDKIWELINTWEESEDN